MTDEEEVLFATAIAMNLACGLDEEELCDLIRLVNQVSCSLSSLLTKKRTNHKG